MTQTWSLWLKCSTSSVTNSRFTLLYICYEHICQQMTCLSSVNNAIYSHLRTHTNLYRDRLVHACQPLYEDTYSI